MNKLILIAAAMSSTFTALSAEKLTLYTSQPNKDAQQTVDAFKAAYPDIDVDWIRDGTTKLMTKLRAELDSGVVNPDVLLIADAVSMESLKRDNHLMAYQSPERENYDASLYDKDGYYHGTKLITSGIVYNTAAKDVPSNWQDFTKPAYKNQIAMPSPLYSGAALIHLATLTDEPSLGWDYYQALATNQAAAQGGNGGVFKNVAAGNKTYGVIVDFLAIREAAKGSPIKFVFPKEGVSMITEPVAIMAKAKNADAAKKFVDFVLSEKGQTMVTEQGYLPARNGAQAPKGFPPRSEIKLMPFDAKKALENTDANKKKFGEMFAQ